MSDLPVTVPVSQVATDPLVRAALDRFPGAVIVSVRNVSAATATLPGASGIIPGLFRDETAESG